MTTIVTRAGKGTPLTNTEVDSNFSNLNTDKLELGGTFSSGTANSILYLNGSKVLTTGSALTFDGTNLGVGASPSYAIDIRNAASTALRVGSSGNAFGSLLSWDNPTGTGRLWTLGSYDFVFGVNSTEQMRLTSTGLGIGTSSPGAKLAVTDAANATQVLLTSAAGTNVQFNTSRSFTVNRNWLLGCDYLAEGSFALIPSTAIGGSTFSNPVYLATATGSHYWYSGATNTMRLDSSGNLGLGVTPSGSFKLEVASGDASIYGITVGRGAGAVSTNTAVGASALAANTTGAYNSAFGIQALTTNTSGERNTAIGRQAMYLNTTGGYNVAVGMNTMEQNTTGAYNTGIGYAALQNNTSADNNTALGYQAGYSITTGTPNVAIGYRALYSATTNGNNVAVGYSAGNALTTGSGNNDCTFIGNLSGYSTTSGYYNTAVGTNSLYANTTGIQNTAIGNFAMNLNTTGVGNSSLGFRALQLNTTGGSNTAVGQQALYSNTTASNNTAVGYQAGYTNQTGVSNTFLGQGAGYNSAGSGGVGSNTFVGTAAGYDITTGTKNTIIGRYQGNQGGLDIRTASNYIVLSDGDGNPQLVVPKNSSGHGYLLVGPTKADPSGGNYYSTISSVGSDVQLILQRTGDAGAGYAGIGASGESALVVYGQGLSSIPFRVKQTDGTVILKDGATAATGTGITFPATQNASSNANTLDDYEEGTWTPTFVDVTYTASATYTEGRYTKIGRVVTVVGVITTDSLDTGDASQVDIGGLPFTVENVNVSYTPATLFIEEGFNASGIDGYQAISVPGSTFIRFYTFTKQTSGNNYGPLLYNQLTGGSQGTRVRFQLTYIV